jgi:hypothetical protein
MDYWAAMLKFSDIFTIHNAFVIKEFNTFIFYLILAVAGTTGIFKVAGKYFNKWSFRFSPGLKGITVLSYSVIEMAVLFVIFVLAATYITANNYEPFIYFRF